MSGLSMQAQCLPVTAKRRGVPLLVMAAAVVVAACSSAPEPTARPSMTASLPAGIPGVLGVVTAGPGPAAVTGTPETIRLTALDGRELAHTTVESSSPVVAGPGGAYWIEGRHLKRLGATGQVSDLGAAGQQELLGAGPSLPGGDSFAVSPDGTQWAYATVGETTQGYEDSVWIGGMAQTPRVIASRIDPNTPAAAATPAAHWVYQLLGWNARGVVIARTLTRICGCSPLTDERFNGHVALVDPQTGISTPVTDDERCPVSGIAGDGTYACFQDIPGTIQHDSMSIRRNGALIIGMELPWANRGEAAVFEPSGARLAYAAVANRADPEAAITATVVHVVDRRTWRDHDIGPVALIPIAWLPDGSLVAQRIVALADGRLAVSAVRLDPATGHLTSVTTGPNLWVVGMSSS